MKKSGLLLLLLTFVSYSYSQQLMINEVSQGSGSSEYVEFVVVGNAICEGDQIPCIDIRKVIFDDNNGPFQLDSTNGTGIASGALRFSDDPFWSCIPQGTIIVVYNDASPNTELPADDISLNDGNCRLVLPGNSPLLESTGASPNGSNPLYPDDTQWVPSLGWTGGGGGGGGVSMNNTNDSFQIPDLNNNGSPLHSVSWGNNVDNVFIYFAGPVGAQVALFKNIVSNDYNDQANWTLEPIATGQTPGAPNSIENDAWIASMNPTCRVNPALTFTTTPATCNTSDGTATVQFSSISANNTIVWENGSSGATLTGVPAGNYTVTVTDLDLGCVYIDSVDVINGGGPTVNASTTDERCMNACDGTANLSINGGTAPYTIAWSSNAGGQSTSNITNLCPDTYSYTITDVNNCVTTGTLTIGAATTITISFNKTDATCGNANGTADPIIAGGNAPFLINWSPTAGTQTGNSLSNLPAGVYAMTLIDNLGCSYVELVSINEIGGPIATVSSTPISCTDPCSGTATATASGGNGTLSYLWDNGITQQTTATASNLCAGVYICTITDANGCKAFVTTTLDPAASFSIIGTTVPETCTGNCDGQINFTPSISPTGLTFALLDPSGNSTTVSPGTITDLCSGNHSLTATDANGCIAQLSLVVGTTNVLDYQLSNDTTICQGSSATLSLSGTGISNILWSDGSTNSSITVTPTASSNYTVSFDQGACQLTRDVDVNVIICLADIDGQLEMPNVFTPDGGGFNDSYFPIILAKDVIITDFKILNRWGNLMFQGAGTEVIWNGKTTDGKEAADGTYYYLITYTYPGQEPITRHGFLQLIRK